MITQENRLISIDTPLGTDVLLLVEFMGTEQLSTPFSFEFKCLSENPNISFADIIGHAVTVSIVQTDGSLRYFNGIISKFAQTSSAVEADNFHDLSAYTATMVPWFWLLTRTSDSRIFQDISVPDLVEQIFSEKNFSDYQLRLSATYDNREYCVQYRETDFNFISRLLEEEGIYYFFEHEQNRHVLVLADSPGEHQPCPLQESARYQMSTGSESLLDDDVIMSLENTQEIRVGRYSTKDFNFKTPNANLLVDATSIQYLGPDEGEVYDYPGEFQTRSRGDAIANIRMQAEEAKVTTITGSSNCRAFVSGYKFDLTEHPRDDMNISYVLLSVSHMVTQGVGGSNQVEGGYVNSFSCIPHEVPYRPLLNTPKPLIAGTQTAIVVGPEGEEIYTDEHGRVKVQFHWDREGENNESSSCWIRVSQAWAGTGWGSMIIPRIGHEVIVEYLEGDPDRPIITGRVYHGTNTPPYPLPAEKTKSAFKSYSSPGGGGFNEIRFEDKKGEEQLFIHAENSQDVRVKGESREAVGSKRHLIISEDQLEQVKGDKHLTVNGDHNEQVDGTMSLKTGLDLLEKVGSNYAVDAGMEIHLKAGLNVVIEAGISITLKVGSSSIVVDNSGVHIDGIMVNINGGYPPYNGSGCSPAAPVLPDEADNAEPGSAIEMQAAPPPPAAAPPPAIESTSAQAQTLVNAAESGTPFCDT